MTHRYLYTIISALLVVVVILTAYAFYQAEDPTSLKRKTPTEYDFVSVSGPIQLSLILNPLINNGLTWERHYLIALYYRKITLCHAPLAT